LRRPRGLDCSIAKISAPQAGSDRQFCFTWVWSRGNRD